MEHVAEYVEVLERECRRLSLCVEELSVEEECAKPKVMAPIPNNYVQTATGGEIVCRTVLDRRNRTAAVMSSQVRHSDGRLMVMAIGSYTIFPRRSASAPSKA